MSGWVDGVHPSRCVEWRWGVLLLSRPAQWRGSCPTHPTAVLASTAVMSCTVPCQVCGVWVVSVCLCCSCGGVSSVCYPLVVVEGGAVVDGGWHSEGRAAVLLTPRRMSVLPVRVLVSPLSFTLCPY